MATVGTLHVLLRLHPLYSHVLLCRPTVNVPLRLRLVLAEWYGPAVSGVAALVQLQVALVGISLPTPVADELLASGVNMSPVRPQVAALAEGLAADVAGVRFLSGVDAGVQL